MECGYCSSGTFSYEINGNAASRAVAIVDDEGLDHTVRMMWSTANKCNESKAILSKLLQSSKSLSGNKRYREDTDSTINKLNGPLKRAMLGELPKINIKSNSGLNSSGGKKKRSTHNETSDNDNHSELPSAASRAQSLLSLALQLRGDERSSQDNDPDSLTRLMANIARSRNRSDQKSRNKDAAKDDGESERDSTGEGVDGDQERKPKEMSKKVLQRCNKLYRQIIEMERDNFEFRKRIIAWKRLNNDALADYGRETNFIHAAVGTSKCLTCSPIILEHLLDLIYVLFTVQDAKFCNKNLSKDFIFHLFDEGDDTLTLRNLKRSMIIALATKSSLASEMIFIELKRRLQGSDSGTCAEILGALSAESIQGNEKFVELSMQTLM